MFENVVRSCMDAGLVSGEGFAVDASVGLPDLRQIKSRERTSYYYYWV